MAAAIEVQPVIKVAALCGSLRKASFNRGLIRSAIKISKEAINGMEIEYVDIAPLPMLNTDLEVDGTYPPAVEAFRQKILEADSILFASPEYNYSVTGTSSSFYFLFFISSFVLCLDDTAVPSSRGCKVVRSIGINNRRGFGGGLSQYHLRQIGVYLDLHFINKPEFFLNAFQPPAKFDAEGNLIDEDAKKRIKEVILSLQAFTRRLQAWN
ncbi:NADPH:quinone oxidoreductase [Vitis vinifera]|uniref:NAD(P)H dehydrogenase (quinone) n=1 Tax=Vitis vinifera TaxID=29760 RepID=A0A438CAT8_VITVI|nr:NADPH:quinone oxidoreductase [Vitis vinifera]